MAMPSKEEYYLKIAEEVAERSKCLRNKGGAIIVRETKLFPLAILELREKQKIVLKETSA